MCVSVSNPQLYNSELSVLKRLTINSCGYILISCLQRKEKAKELYNTHIAPNSSDPVNVDSHAQKMTGQGLEQAKPNLFDVAQKQVCYIHFNNLLWI